MKKRLLFALMALCVTVSGFALSKNEFVYTPQGRFQITGDNIVSCKFQNFDGWTVVGEGITLEDRFNVNTDGFESGSNSVQSTELVTGQGMYYKFVPTDAGSAYVVSFKMKGAALVTTRLNTIGYNGSNESLGDILPNGVKIEGNSDHEFGGTTDVKVCNTAEELTEDWQTFYYAIGGDGTARTYFISFMNMDTNVQIADLQIAPAMQFADLRQRDAMVSKMEVYKNAYDWPAEALAEFGYDEAIANLKAVGDVTGQIALEEQLATAQEILDEFVKANMDDYFAGNTDNYLGIKTTDGNLQKVSVIGDWNCLPGGRGFWSNGDHPDMGHFQKSSQWAYNDPAAPMGVYMQKTLDPGSYVFAIESRAALRENAQQSWWIDEGMKPAYGEAYIVKIVEGAEQPDTIVKEVKDLQAVLYTPFIISAKIAESGSYEIGLKAYCKEAYKEQLLGSVVYVADASLWGKNENKYNQKQLGYEENVRAQITAGREALDKANAYLTDESYSWGKAVLKAVVDVVEPLIAGYEAMDQDAIIATFDEDTYVNTTSEETGLLQYTVYQEATKLILEANREFEAENATLASLQTAIDNAEATMALRLYSAATGKTDLQAAIDKAKATQATLKAAEYSEENAATVTATNEELAAAVETFKSTIPASAIATIVDIDFENDAVQNEETQLYSVTGAVGTMEFSSFSTDGTGDQPFEKGYWSNGEQMWKGYIRVGNGTGTVNFDPSVNGSMGTNILKVNFDFFLQGLSKRYVGFFMKDDNVEEPKTVAGFFANYYDNDIDTQSNLNIELGSLQYGSGRNYNNARPEGEEGEGSYCAKNSFEVVLDFGENTMYCVTTSSKGVVMTEKQEFDGTVPRNFILQCNYNNNDRRVWFDNLKIVRISTDATGISFVNADAKAQNGAIYNLAGQKVNKNFKGVVIKNGKKAIQK